MHKALAQPKDGGRSISRKDVEGEETSLSFITIKGLIQTLMMSSSKYLELSGLGWVILVGFLDKKQLSLITIEAKEKNLMMEVLLVE